MIHIGVAGLQCGPDKMEWRSIRAAGAEAALRGKALSMDALVTAMEELQHDIRPGNTPGGCKQSFDVHIGVDMSNHIRGEGGPEM